MRLTDIPAATALDGSETALGLKAGVATLLPLNRLPNPPGVTNLTPPSLGKWRAALAKQRAGIANARVALVGDSTTFGYLAAPTPNGYVGAQPYGRVGALVKHLVQLGEAAQSEGFVNDGAVSANGNTLAQYDARVALGSGWASGSGVGFGGSNLRNSSTTSALAFTPAQSFDTIEVLYATLSGGGSFTVDVDGGAALGTVSTDAGGGGCVRATFTCALGAHTVNLKRSGGSVYVVGVNTFNSAKKAILAFAIAAAGCRASDFAVGANDGYASGPNLAGFPADLYVVDLTVNDWLAGTAPAAYQASLQTVIGQCAGLGSVLLMSGPPSNPSAAAVATQAAYRAVAASLAQANGLPYLDMTQTWGGYAGSSSLLYADSLHPNTQGYSDLAGMIAELITRRL